MKVATTHHNGWTIQVKEDRRGNPNRNANHGINTIIGQVPSTLNLAQGRGVYNAAGCGACVYFPTCPKGVRADTDSCQWRPNRFQSARRIQ